VLNIVLANLTSHDDNELVMSKKKGGPSEVGFGMRHNEQRFLKSEEEKGRGRVAMQCCVV